MAEETFLVFNNLYSYHNSLKYFEILQSRIPTVLYLILIYVIAIASDSQVFYPKFKLNKKNCLYTFLEFVRLLHNFVI